MIKLEILKDNQWLLALRVLLMLAIGSACINYQLLLAIMLLGVFLKLDWIADKSGFFKLNDSKLTLIIFPGGRVRLESTDNIIEGYLGSKQWCTSHIAIIQVIDGSKSRNLMVLSALQENKKDFRRFNMWIRQDFYRDAKGVQTSGK